MEFEGKIKDQETHQASETKVDAEHSRVTKFEEEKA